jgi:hypothetical protein
MKLTRVTITGADDLVDPNAMLDLSEAYPFVEWAILSSRKKQGASRYPSQEWVRRFACCAALTGVRWAMHLCGESARRALAGCPDAVEVYAEIGELGRVQLNGFGAYRLPMLRLAERMQSVHWILQVQDWGPLHHAGELAKLHPNVFALWDRSGGRGIGPGPSAWFEWPWPTVDCPRLGYAGGIDPSNIARAAEQVTRFMHVDGQTWLDLESGARTDDKFDLHKVQRILELAKPFVLEAP